MGHATHVSFADAAARFHGRRAVPWSINPGDCHLVIDMEYGTGRYVTLTRRHGDGLTSMRRRSAACTDGREPAYGRVRSGAPNPWGPADDLDRWVQSRRTEAVST